MIFQNIILRLVGAATEVLSVESRDDRRHRADIPEKHVPEPPNASHDAVRSWIDDESSAPPHIRRTRTLVECCRNE